jgi:hypothetical protein
MASWRKVITSGSDANLKNLTVSQSISATSITGSLLGSAQSAEIVVVNSDTAPTGSLSGSLWFNTDNLTLYVYYIDPSGSSYWLPTYNAGIPVTSSYSISSSLADSAKTASYYNTDKLATTGSNTFVGNQIISGTLFITGVTTLGGNIVPATAQGATLGTVDKPFAEIFISSGSINIASDTPGDPNTSISNIDGNLLISAGGIQLVGSGSFNASTGSFSYISGSMTQVGNYTQVGDHTLTGNSTISGSLTLSSGSALRINNGFYVDGNRQFNYGQFCDTTIQSGSANTAQTMRLNTTDISQGVSVVSGSQIKVDNTGLYNLQFSTQLEQTTNGASDISIWLRKNGVDVANSNTELTIEKVAGGGKLVAAWNYIVQLNANQYMELVWSSNSANTQLHYHTTQTTPTRPATPSVILTLTQIA